MNTVNRSATVIVDNTDTDRLTFGGESFGHANELQLILSAPASTRFDDGSGEVDGGNFIVFQDLDFYDDSVITGVSFSSSFAGVDKDDVVFGDGFVRFNVEGVIKTPISTRGTFFPELP